MGLPGSGKTYLAERLVPILNAAWYNADKLREMANDWDFSDEGRRRQSRRMRTFADFEKDNDRYVVCDFVCPTKETRENFDADIVIWSKNPLSIYAIVEATYVDGGCYFSIEKDQEHRNNIKKEKNRLLNKLIKK